MQKNTRDAELKSLSKVISTEEKKNQKTRKNFDLVKHQKGVYHRHITLHVIIKKKNSQQLASAGGYRHSILSVENENHFSIFFFTFLVISFEHGK